MATGYDLLPKMENPISTGESTIGQWNETDIATRIAEEFVVSNKNMEEISSIPDVWGYARMYSKILCENTIDDDPDKQHAFFEDYRNMWRGVMALVCLRNDYFSAKDFRLRKFKIKIDKHDKERRAGFHGVLQSLAPNELIKDYYVDDQYEIQMITYKDQPVAFVWPTVLLCPSVRLGEVDLGNIKWFSGEKFLDPIQYLTEGEKLVLFQWLKDILASIDGIRDKQKQKDTQGARALVQYFLNDICAALGLQETDDSGLKQCDDINNPFKFDGLCSCMGENCYQDKSINDNDKVTGSYVLLLKQNGEETDIKIVGKDIEDMMRQWNKQFPDVKELLVEGRKTVYNMGDIKHFSDDDIFTSSIIIAERGANGESVFPNAYSHNTLLKYDQLNWDATIPVKKWLLSYFNAEALNSRVSMSEFQCISENNETRTGIRVSIELPLSGMGGHNFVYKLTKNFYAETDIKEKKVPLVKVWPNFETEDRNLWQCYYTFCNLNYELDGLECTFYVEPTWDKENSLRKCRYDDQSQITVLQAGKTFPDAFVCYLMENDGNGKMDCVIGDKDSTKAQREKKEAGLILIDRHSDNSNFETIKKLKGQDSICTIGVDFGTTNSVAYVRTEDTQELSPVVFKNRVFDVAGSIAEAKSEKYAVARILSKYFIPATQQPGTSSNSIRTTLMKKNNMVDVIVNEDNSNIKLPLLEYGIFFLDEKYFTPKDAKNLTADSGLLFNLKWDGTQVENSQEQFLQLFCMQCMAEAIAHYKANKINWRYTFPRALDKSVSERNEKRWGRVIDFLDSSICASGINKLQNKNSVSESEAFAAYWEESERISLSHGTICCDIGGGSTDVAIREDEDHGYQASFKFAGKDLLTDYLFYKNKKDRAIFASLKNASSAGQNDAYNDFLKHLDMYSKNPNDAGSFNICLEYVLKSFEKTLIGNLDNGANSNDLLKEVFRDIRFGLSGVFFYMGMVVGSICAKDEECKFKEELPDFYIGGNGSKLFDWCVQGNFTELSEREGEAAETLLELLKNMFKIGICFITKDEDIMDNNSKIVIIRKSANPKSEVAFGAVQKNTIRTAKDKPNKGRVIGIPGVIKKNPVVQTEFHHKEINIAGEEFSVKGSNEQYEPTEEVTKDMIKQEISIGRMDYFRGFVANFNEYNGVEGSKDNKFRQVSFDEETYKVLRNRTIKAYKDAKDSLTVDPVFIVILREAVKILAEK